MARARYIWRQEGRVHLRLNTDVRDHDAAARMARALEQVPGVQWARVHGRLGCVVLEMDRDEIDHARLLAALVAAEAEHGRGEPMARQHPERHPGDIGPVARAGVELVAEGVSLACGALLRRWRARSWPLELDLAALLELATGIPRVRKWIEQLAGVAGAQFALDLARAGVHTLLHSEAGSLVGMVRRGLRLRELRARRTLWRECEPEMCGSPEQCPQPAPDREPRRPCPAPHGLVERYSGKAAMASIGGFFAALLATRDHAGATGSIFAGMPRPARYGRDAFAAHLGYRLARAGMLVIEPHTLRKLDRIDCVLLDARLLAIDDRGASRLERAIGDASLRAVVVSDNALETLRALQLEGHAVCAIGLGPWPALAAADFGVALAVPDAAPPWHADVICRRQGPAQAIALVDAIAAARQVSRHGVGLAVMDAAVGAGLAFAGLEARTVRRIMQVANAASILAIIDGVRLAQGIALASPAGQAREGVEPPAPAPRWHAMTVEDVLRHLDTSSSGLTEAQAEARQGPRPEPPSSLARLVSLIGDEMSSSMMPVLAAGAGLSLATGAFTDAALVTSVLAINGAVGGVQRYQAERELSALSQVERHTVRVRRAKETTEELMPDRLVPGDVIELASGDVVPADCRVVEAHALEVDESSLTGESLPVAKSADPVATEVVAERSSMLYEATAIAAGRALAVVIAVGSDTEAARAYEAGHARPAAGGVEARLESLMSLTAPLALGCGLVVAVTSLARGARARDVVGAGVSLAVAAVPEGLPLLATMAQLAAARRLSQRGALVRKPRSIEALGRVDVLCADKTGTLTEGRIRLRLVSDGRVARPPEKLDDEHRRILAVALRASPSTDSGDPIPHLTDRALVEGARRASVGSHDELEGWQRLHEVPFEPGRAFHVGLAAHEGGRLLSIKGAPEVVLAMCDLSERERERLAGEAVRLARQGYRVLAVAERDGSGHGSEVDVERIDKLCFCGFVAFADPVRATARAAVEHLRRAGVDIVMVTGDHPSTAQAIAGELDLRNRDRVVTGPELEQLDDAGLDAIIGNTGVFARVTPVQKVRIVAALQRAGRVVAMTGDGANDAPAIRLADVGIALGKGSTAAARDAADMVVTDERIETIVTAALEGRALWTSVRDAVSILVGGNVGEIMFTLVGGVLTGQAPLNARQLLLVNLVTDTLPALVIALRPPAVTAPEKLVREGPEASLGQALSRDIALRAGITGGSATAGWLAARLTGDRAGASTVALLALTGSQLMQTLVVGAHSLPVVATGVGSLAVVLGIAQTPVLSHFFGCRPLGPLGLGLAGLAIGAGAAAALVSRR